MAPKTDYRAPRETRHLSIYVTDWGEGTRVQVSWHERSRGDGPTDGRHRRAVVYSNKPVKGLEHALNLAEWAIRQARAKPLPEHDPLAFLRK